MPLKWDQIGTIKKRIQDKPKQSKSHVRFTKPYAQEVDGVEGKAYVFGQKWMETVDADADERGRWKLWIGEKNKFEKSKTKIKSKCYMTKMYSQLLRGSNGRVNRIQEVEGTTHQLRRPAEDNGYYQKGQKWQRTDNSLLSDWWRRDYAQILIIKHERLRTVR